MTGERAARACTRNAVAWASTHAHTQDNKTPTHSPYLGPVQLYRHSARRPEAGPKQSLSALSFAKLIFYRKTAARRSIKNQSSTHSRTMSHHVIPLLGHCVQAQS